MALNQKLLIQIMRNKQDFDVIVVGGSYSGLAAGMALGRALRKVLIIDSGEPCNRQTPQSHNFLTQDGKTPKEIALLARKQVERYGKVEFLNDLAIDGNKNENGFQIKTASGKIFQSRKLIFATGVRDIMPAIEGFSDCWGISVLHCPYCHGYEVRGEKTGILGNGDYGCEFSRLISNWTKDLTLYTNGKSTLTKEQNSVLNNLNINIVEKEIKKVEQFAGHIDHIIFKDATKAKVNFMYTKTDLKQNTSIPIDLGCELTDEGYIKVDPMQRTTIPGIFSCGDNSSQMRTLANAVSTGTTAGMVLNKEFVLELTKFTNEV